MVTYMPIASPFVRLAGFWVDDAFSFAMGWNYFFLMGESLLSSFRSGPWAPPVLFSNRMVKPAFNIPYEITAIHVLLTYWTDKVPIAAVIVACLVLYRHGSCYFTPETELSMLKQRKLLTCN